MHGDDKVLGTCDEKGESLQVRPLVSVVCDLDEVVRIIHQIAIKRIVRGQHMRSRREWTPLPQI